MIQPFDGGEYDSRYRDVITPAIQSLGVIPYRVDEDPSASVPIETIEERIRNSRFCLADISTDNPNVWYEVGYALAREKDIILISKVRAAYPFDIRHRKVISYQTNSPSDFTDLSEKIIERAKVLLKEPIRLESPVSVNADFSGLSYQEISMLGAIMKCQDTPESGVTPWNITQSLAQSGLNEIAFSLAVKKLLRREFISLVHEQDYNGNEYIHYYIAEKGWAWILENEDKFDTRVRTVTVETQSPEYDEIPDDLPF